MSPRTRRAVAALYGLACHGSFLVGVGWTALSLYGGMRAGLGRLHGTPALLADALLLIQFPLLHSFLLSARGRSVLGALAPRGLGGSLAPTSFALVAGLQLAATFALWSPSGVIWWQPTGAALHALQALFAGAWLFLLRALRDGGLGLQTGWIGWTAVWRDTRPAYGGMPQHGTFALCRQPIYLGFALTLWTGPVWTPDHLAIALSWSVYCLVGPLLKERRFATRYGPAFAAYRARVPYILPRIVPSTRRPKS